MAILAQHPVQNVQLIIITLLQALVVKDAQKVSNMLALLVSAIYDRMLISVSLCYFFCLLLPGMWTNGLIAQTGCSGCPVNWYNPSTTNNCTACAAGSWTQSHTGYLNCTLCASSHYWEPSNGNCIVCPVVGATVGMRKYSMYGFFSFAHRCSVVIIYIGYMDQRLNRPNRQC